jgi:hypothetical protein
MISNGFPTSYAEFCHLITQRCGTALTRAYCNERITALRDTHETTTRDFLRFYGPQHHQQIIAWYEQAAREAFN